MHCENDDCKNDISVLLTCEYCSVPRYCRPNCKRIHWVQVHQYFCRGKSTEINLHAFSGDLENSRLGKGSYGEVTKITHKQSNKAFALKRISKKMIERFGISNEVLREMNVHQSLNHQNVIQLYGCCQDENHIYMILEYAPNGSVFQFIRTGVVLSEKEMWSIFTQTCIGIAYLHRQNIIHRDLKPENLLLDQFYNVKISDFGWSVQSEEPRQTFCGTLDYMAPEILTNQAHSFAVDLWALGVFLYEISHGYAPFTGAKSHDKRGKIVSGVYEISGEVGEDLADLIRQLIQLSPDSRLPLLQVLQHPWVAKFSSNSSVSLGQKVVSTMEGEGYISSINGLICNIKFGNQESPYVATDLLHYLDLKLVYEAKVVRNPALQGSADAIELEGIESGSSSEEILDDDHIVETFFVSDLGDPSGGLLAPPEFYQLEVARNIRNPIVSIRGNVRKLRHKTVPKEVPIRMSVPIRVDLSADTLRERQLELERLSMTLEKNERYEGKRKAVASLRRKQKPQSSFWSNLFGCSARG